MVRGALEKNKAGKGDESITGGQGLHNRVVSEGLTEKVTFKKMFEGGVEM